MNWKNTLATEITETTEDGNPRNTNRRYKWFQNRSSASAVILSEAQRSEESRVRQRRFGFVTASMLTSVRLAFFSVPSVFSVVSYS